MHEVAGDVWWGRAGPHLIGTMFVLPLERCEAKPFDSCPRSRPTFEDMRQL
jgi:hypothetical protein